MPTSSNPSEDTHTDSAPALLVHVFARHVHDLLPGRFSIRVKTTENIFVDSYRLRVRNLHWVWPSQNSQDPKIGLKTPIICEDGDFANPYTVASTVLDKLIDKGLSNNDIINERISLLKDIHDLDKRHSSDLAQKAKIQWAIEGDENSKYFHGIVNKNGLNLLFVVFLSMESGLKILPNKFSPGSNSSFITLIPKSLDAKMVKDFRPISLIGSFYKILSNYLCIVMPDLISDVQTAFISKRQILDGPFILNELISWCKYHKIKAMIFKADFEKAFDSVRWDYLDGVLNNFGFGVKWRGWIQACLSSAMGSILVNGSPSSEFKFYKGLKQGDPLSPFLFILVMESLHISFNNILNSGLYKGIRIDESLTLSHLFYADDAVFIGKWDKANVITIVILCLNVSSGF
ncbi:RNA-directed DNA polymerase, eukaryota [Tanacetum coccineum]